MLSEYQSLELRTPAVEDSRVTMYSVKEESLRRRVVRRALDISVGFILALVSAPVWLLAALAVRLETKGNPFFVQERVGLGGKSFKMVKLRGMYSDARERFPHLYDYARFGGGLDFHFHYTQDPRITRVGAFIRKTSIDELPNFLNVVRGDMTLIGPRPEIPDVLELYGECGTEYLSVKPGITCLSKITGRDKLTKAETIEIDLDYVRNASFRLDMSIFWQTLKGVLRCQDVFDGGLIDGAIIDIDSLEQSPD
jgi:lipopolysaccharide/colanic/teichoic acid biosynthesis glycosyltransferase